MTHSRARVATVALLGFRIAYGVTLVAAPTRLARRWLGPAAETASSQVPLRGLGAREALIHGGALAAALTGAPLRPWLAASIAGDLTDIVATTAGREQLPEGSALATLVVAGTSALISAALAAAIDR
jgi:hypothetical protein